MFNLSKNPEFNQAAWMAEMLMLSAQTDQQKCQKLRAILQKFPDLPDILVKSADNFETRAANMNQGVFLAVTSNQPKSVSARAYSSRELKSMANRRRTLATFLAKHLMAACQ